jgi:hypothetical protein
MHGIEGLENQSSSKTLSSYKGMNDSCVNNKEQVHE